MKTVLTNGCFDVLHEGHLALLRHCRELAEGGPVVVAINTDESIRLLKGRYPANRLGDRIAALYATDSVSRTEPFHTEEQLAALVASLKPDYLVKGSDYRGKPITGQAELEACGGKLVLFDVLPGLSSTAAINDAGISKVRITRHDKGWGHELVFANTDAYCGKLLVLDKGEGSMHFHGVKDESWYVQSGHYILFYLDLVTAQRKQMDLHPGDAVRLKPLNPHKLVVVESGVIFEASTHDDPKDSLRIEPGSSQSCTT